LLNATTTVRFSRGAIDDMRRYYSLPPQVRFDVIPAGVTGSQLEGAVDQARAHSPQRRLLSVGRLVESKNLAFLLHCLAELLQEPWRLDVVGDGPDRSRLEQLAASLNLRERVYFHGRRDAVDGFYASADLFVFPSRLESYGLVILEAMARGVPTLAIAADGRRYQNANAEIITDGVDGLVAADERRFHARLADCLAQRVPLDELGRHARETFERRHQWPAVLDRWEELLGELSQRQHRAVESVAV
jgi:glycosyltransferase involved in cell wall biosynthesis